MAKRRNRYLKVQKLPPHRGSVILTGPAKTPIRECRLIKVKKPSPALAQMLETLETAKRDIAEATGLPMLPPPAPELMAVEIARRFIPRSHLEWALAYMVAALGLPAASTQPPSS